MSRRRGINSSQRGSVRKGNRNFWWLVVALAVFIMWNRLAGPVAPTGTHRPAPAATAKASSHPTAHHTARPKTTVHHG